MNLETKRAITILSGWLEAAKIPYVVNNTTVIVNGRNLVNVCFGEGNCDSIHPRTLTSSLEVSMPAFWKITERAGFGRPVVIKRGPDVDAVSYQDDPEMVAMRHREFRKVANPPGEIYKNVEYKKIVAWFSSRFYNSHRSICDQAGYDTSDVSQFCWIFVTNFYGLWRHPEGSINTALGHKNQKLLCGYLRQRLDNDLRKMLTRKVRSIYLDEEGSAIGQNIEFVRQYSDDASGFPGHSSSVAVSLVREDDEFEITHDEIVKGLAIRIKKGQALAKKAWTLHLENCEECKRESK